ncbi:transcriptional Coactivator p15-domain-containing protein [Apiospora rasikravindrae]|uniref:Transcriptional Coactivator p15-domain-containing protein n=1 Tax=Apiospora rasikravindrae TaxID=990691 RepID=A0ABR1T6N0_9PEZI
MSGYKTAKRSRRDEDSDSEPEVAKPTKSTKKVKTGKNVNEAEGGADKDAEGNSFWPLTATRRVVISEFKGKPLISVREYYTDAAGEMKPGKKGISLTLEQWNNLMKATTDVNAELTAKGYAVADPSASSAPAASTSTAKPSKDGDKLKKSKKANIEATSDEEDEDEE